jgi:thiol:disulfide interchange protein DsbD
MPVMTMGRRRIAEASSRVPRPSPEWKVTAAPHGDGFMVRLSPLAGVEIPRQDSIEFFAEDENVIDHAAPQLVSRDGADLVISLEPSPYATALPEVLRGVVLVEGGWAPDGSHPALAVAAPIEGTEAGALAGVGGASSGITLWLAIVFAFFGGIILNLMPCVFPVLSIKILGFVQSAGEDRAVIRRHGWMFGAGVLVSFLLLAGLLLMLRAGGEELGWGFQLQSPAFVAAMAVLLFVLGLSLAGVFEIGTSLIRYAGEIGLSKGYGASFWSGVLATVVATPCTAPFMGSALGFALSQPAASALSVFAVLGLGMATPYVLLSMSPGLVRRLPRPGAWMETFKELMAFPLFATVVWLVWVFGQQTGNDGVAYLLLALTLLSVAVWILGRWPGVTISPRFRIVTRSFALIATLAALWFVARGSSMQASASGGPLVDGELTWNVYSEEAVQEARASGRPVFIDFTAAWCLSCKVNETVALGNADVRARFQELDVVLFKADWTNRDPEITRALASFGRSGVPLYVLYSIDPQAPPYLLPEIISPGIVLSALEGLPPQTAMAGRPGGRTAKHM